MPINKKAELELASELVNILEGSDVTDELITGSNSIVVSAACPCLSQYSQQMEESNGCGPDCQCSGECQCNGRTQEGTMSTVEVQEEKKEMELFTKIKECLQEAGEEVERAEEEVKKLMQMPEHTKVAIRLADKLDVAGYRKTANIIDNALMKAAQAYDPSDPLGLKQNVKPADPWGRQQNATPAPAPLVGPTQPKQQNVQDPRQIKKQQAKRMWANWKKQNDGPNGLTMQIQKNINAVAKNPVIAEDGKYGPATLRALQNTLGDKSVWLPTKDGHAAQLAKMVPAAKPQTVAIAPQDRGVSQHGVGSTPQGPNGMGNKNKGQNMAPHQDRGQ